MIVFGDPDSDGFRFRCHVLILRIQCAQLQLRRILYSLHRPMVAYGVVVYSLDLPRKTILANRSPLVLNPRAPLMCTKSDILENISVYDYKITQSQKHSSQKYIFGTIFSIPYGTIDIRNLYR